MLVNDLANNETGTPRKILGSVTRQCHLTSQAQKIYKKTVLLAKERNRMNNRIIGYKTRLKDSSSQVIGQATQGLKLGH